MVIAIAVNKNKLIKFPMPRKRMIKNTVKAVVAIRPRLKFEKMSEKVRRQIKKTKMKKRGTTKKVVGSIKVMRKSKRDERRTIAMIGGRIFFGFLGSV